MTERPGDGAKVPCPTCGSFKSHVKEGRSTRDGGYRRRRKCRDCGQRFITIERFVQAVENRRSHNI